MEVSDHQSRPRTVHLGQLSLGTEREGKLCCLFGQRLCTPLPASLLLLLVLLFLLIVVLLLSSPSLSFFFFLVIVAVILFRCCSSLSFPPFVL